MAEDSGGQGARRPKPGDDLGDRIERAKKEAAPDQPEPGYGRAYSVAWRMTLDLVIATAVGFGVGWGLDSLLGVKPLLMIVFGLLGFAAGVRMVLRAAQDLGRD